MGSDDLRISDLERSQDLYSIYRKLGIKDFFDLVY